MTGKIEESPSLSLVNELDYSSTPIPQKHPRNERVTSAEELGTMSKNILRGITLGIRPIWRTHSLTLSSLIVKYAVLRPNMVAAFRLTSFFGRF